MVQYESLLKDVLTNGQMKPSRPGINTLSVFGRTVEFDLMGRKLPMVTAKYTWWKGIVAELLWFLRGKSDRSFLLKHKVRTWDHWHVPYHYDRPVIAVPRIKKEYVPPFPDRTREEAGWALRYLEGEIPGVLMQDEQLLCISWIAMMQRAYGVADPDGALISVSTSADSVCERWQKIENFIEDAKTLPHWTYKKQFELGYRLSISYHDSNQFAPDTAVWLSDYEDELLTDKATPIYLSAERKDGKPRMVYLLDGDGKFPPGVLQTILNRYPPPMGEKHEDPEYPDLYTIGWEFVPTEVGNDSLCYRLALINPMDMGPIYGVQWRKWPKYEGGHVDQIEEIIEGLKTDPYSRRYVLSAWNVPSLSGMALPPCHMMAQFCAYPGKGSRMQLDCHVYQRSADLFLGVPWNWASYALLTNIIADYVGMKAHRLVWTGGDIHLYENQLEQAREVLDRGFYPPTSRLKLSVPRYTNSDIGALEPDYFQLEGYHHKGVLTAEVAV